MIRAALILWIALWGGAVGAQEFLTTKGKMEDDAFYRLVSCAALPDKACQKPIIRWNRYKATRIRVAMTVADPGYPPELQAVLWAGIKDAVAQINSSGAQLKLRIVQRRPDIQIMFRDIPAGSTLTPLDLPGLRSDIQIEAAHVRVWWNNRREISRSSIVFSREISKTGAKSLALEELTQAMGFLTDIRNPYYNTRSIFSQDSNAVTQLAGQDVMVLRRHYPKP